jgi:hypothetical protein
MSVCCERSIMQTGNLPIGCCFSSSQRLPTHFTSRNWPTCSHSTSKQDQYRNFINNFHHRCRAAPLSATASSTGSIHKRRAVWWTQRAYGSSSDTANIGPRNRCIAFARDHHLSDEALCTCLYHPTLRLHILMCLVSVIMFRTRLIQIRT